jgi:hypothetical protein
LCPPQVHVGYGSVNVNTLIHVHWFLSLLCCPEACNAYNSAVEALLGHLWSFFLLCAHLYLAFLVASWSFNGCPCYILESITWHYDSTRFMWVINQWLLLDDVLTSQQWQLMTYIM